MGRERKGEGVETVVERERYEILRWVREKVDEERCGDLAERK